MFLILNILKPLHFPINQPNTIPYKLSQRNHLTQMLLMPGLHTIKTKHIPIVPDALFPDTNELKQCTVMIRLIALNGRYPDGVHVWLGYKIIL